MEEFLRDNPDYGSSTTPKLQIQPNTNSSEISNFNDTDPFSLGPNEINQYDFDNINGNVYSNDTNKNTDNSNSTTTTTTNNNNGLSARYNYQEDFLSPSTSYGNDNNNFGILNYDPQMDELYQTTSYPTSLNNEVQAFQSVSPQFGSPGSNFQAIGRGAAAAAAGGGGFLEPQNATNLDELISPSNTIDGNLDSGSFLNPQYFSPNNKNTYGQLNPIAEAGILNTPSISRHGSISVPHQSNTGNSIYISKQNYMSPTNQIDFLRSPPNNGGVGTELLNSPPTEFFNSPNIKAPINIPKNSTTQNIYNDNYDLLKDNSINNNQNSFTTTNNITNDLVGGSSLPDPNILSSHSTAVAASTSPNGSSLRSLTKEEKLKRRREFHNAVERRRRDLIKERIKQLGLLVPPSLLNPQLLAVQTLQNSPQTAEISELLTNVKAKESKPNKSTILNMSVVYLKHLEYVLDQQKKRRLELEKEISNLENQLNNVTLDQQPVQSSSYQDNPGNIGYENNEIKLENNNPIEQSTQQFDPDQFFQANGEFIDDVYNL